MKWFWKKKSPASTSAPEGKEKKKLIHRLKSKSRLVIMNDTTFEERFSLMLSPMNLFIGIGVFSILLVLLTTFIIAYTPLKEYIPGYPSSEDRLTAQRNEIRADSLEKELNKYDNYLRDLKILLSGGDFEQPNSDSLNKVSKENLSFNPSSADLAFREKMKEEERNNPTTVNRTGYSNSLTGILFFVPLDGVISQGFSKKGGHFGIDIVSAKNESIKTTLDGTVIFADWTSDGGHEIHIQHAQNIVSVYKHNSSLLKKTGELVKAGDPIAIIGDSGELSDGPHLHFELWVNGKPVDPQLYLAI